MSHNKKRISDDDLLDKRISEQRIEKYSGLFICSGILTAIMPTYLYAAVLNFETSDAINLVLLCTLPLAAAYALSRAYDIMFETEYHKRIHHFVEAKDAAQLQRLRVQCALTWAMFFVNGLFLLLTIFLQQYIFRNLDLRINFVLTFVLAALAVWAIASKNEESRQRKKNLSR